MNEKYDRNDVIIVLPKTEIPPLKRITLFLLGFSGGPFIYHFYQLK